MNISSYYGLFKMQFKGELQYRGKAISGIFTQFFWGIMYIYLYTSFMKGGIEGFSISQMATYIWLGQAFFALRRIDSQPKVNMEIANGDVCYRFVRPLNVYNQWYTELAGQKVASTLLRCFPIIIISVLLPANMRLSMPVNIWAFLLFLVALVIGMFLAITVTMFAYNFTFATMCSKGASGLVNVIVGLFNGGIIPIPLMPSSMQTLVKWLPFGCISDLPFRIYCGNINLKEGAIRICLGVIWFAVLVFIGKLILKKQLKNVVVQGG